MQKIHEPPALPPRPLDGHKGLFGRLLIVGGNPEMIGAPVLAGEAALRTGSGLVQVAMPASVLVAGLMVVPELIGLALKKRDSRHRELSTAVEKADVILAGPGMGQSPAAAERIKYLITLTTPMVLDADALNYLSSLKKWPRSFKAQAILTPHPGEMGRLNKLLGKKSEVPTDDQGRIDLAAQAAQEFGQIMVLKGHRTVVTDGRQYYLNHTGDSSLSKAGAGDILSGILASLLGQKMEPFQAACAAVHLHGLAGELAGKKLGLRSVLARDVIDAIPQAIETLKS